MTIEQRKILKILLAIIVVVVVIFAAYQIYLYVSRIGKVAITVNVAPNDASVVFSSGSKKYSGGNGVRYLPPGSYTVNATQTGFSSYSQKVSLKKGVTPKPLFIALTPESSEAKTWAQNNMSQFNEIDTKSEQYDSSHKTQSKSAAIFAQLPYQDAYYMIGYQNQSDGQPEITIETASPQYRYEAFQHIYQMGFNPADYHIVFTDYTNPLGAASK